MNTSLKIENLSKAYHTGNIGTGTLYRDVEHWFSRLLKKSPAHTFSVPGIRKEEKWIFKNLNMDIKQSDIIGLLGSNGAGKSTLLKIISKVTTPTEGRITGYGRVASLLEIGAGFHPELSGTENIYLNGAMLGMQKIEIKRKLEEILNFAELDHLAPIPVKKYSSGMYMRLAFSIVAVLEPEILIVDEVLAVADIDFQNKCLNKLKALSENKGSTILFVSHNEKHLKSICNKGFVLHQGSSAGISAISEALTTYQSHQMSL